MLVLPHPETSAVKRSHRPVSSSLLKPRNLGACRAQKPSVSLTSRLLKKGLVSQPLPESKEQGQAATNRRGEGSKGKQEKQRQ